MEATEEIVTSKDLEKAANYNPAKDPKAIQELVENWIIPCEDREFTREEIFMRVALHGGTDEQAQENLDRTVKEFGEGVLYTFKILSNRCKALHINIDLRTRIFLTLSGACMNPGEAVIYLAYLIHKTKDDAVKFVSFDTFCNMFPERMLTSRGMREVWKQQKIEVDGRTLNLLDCGAAYKSLYKNAIPDA